VVRLRLLDFRRSLRRNEQRFQRAWKLGHRLNDAFLGDSPIPGQIHDLARELEGVLNLLDAPIRALWMELCQGKRLRDLPEVLGASYRTVKRRWRTLRDQLAATFPHLSKVKRLKPAHLRRATACRCARVNRSNRSRNR
jgi:hypothetical protein